MIEIIIVEDHPLFRKGIHSLLSKTDDFIVTDEFENGKQYIDNIKNVKADIVLMDVEMPVMNGIKAAGISYIKRPEIQIIALSMYADQNYYYEMIQAGVSGFVQKEASLEELEKAIRDVYKGMGFFSSRLLQEAVTNFKSQNQKKKALKEMQITEREMEILRFICQGLTSQEISQKLSLSPRTVEAHKANLMRKTNNKNTVSLILYAIKNDLIEI